MTKYCRMQLPNTHNCFCSGNKVEKRTESLWKPKFLCFRSSGEEFSTSNGSNTDPSPLHLTSTWCLLVQRIICQLPVVPHITDDYYPLSASRGNQRKQTLASQLVNSPLSTHTDRKSFSWGQNNKILIFHTSCNGRSLNVQYLVRC